MRASLFCNPTNETHFGARSAGGLQHIVTGWLPLIFPSFSLSWTPSHLLNDSGQKGVQNGDSVRESVEQK